MSSIDIHRPDQATPPRSLFGYDVVDFIGQGAGSNIYLVSDPLTNQIYALKHVVRKTDKDARFVEQLENEYEISRHFAHPNLRKSIDMKLEKTWLGKVTEAALVMELVDGLPMDASPPAGVLNILNVFIQTGEALAALHATGHCHCDLKPNNILISPGGSVKVIDFGQACKCGTVKERIQGTPDYIAPEQVKREMVTYRTDVFNFGATLYWALTNQKIPTLFTLKKDENSFLVHDQIPTPAELNPEVPEALSNLVMECVRINPLKRPESMAEVTRRLEVIRHAATRRQAAQTQTQTQTSGLRRPIPV